MNGCVILGKVVTRFGFLVLASVFYTQIALADIFEVNTHTPYADANPGDCICAGSTGLCGLNTAIAEANACDGIDTIRIPSETYNSGNISISSGIIFQGLGTELNPTILQFTGTSTIVVETVIGVQYVFGEFRNLTLRGGKYISIAEHGRYIKLDSVTVSGFYNDASVFIGTGNLTINSSKITGNSTGSSGSIIATGGGLVINDSELYQNSAPSGCGGVISHSSTSSATINNTRIYDNTAEKGGAICALGGNIRITGSSLTNNMASLEGGAIYNGGSTGGAAIYLTNTTLSGNRADGNGGAIMIERGSLRIASSTITNNVANADNTSGGSGGGVYKADSFYGTVFMKNTIVAQNTYLSGILEPHSDCRGEIRSDGFNLIGFRGFACTILSSAGDQIGHHAAIDPLLNSLALIGATKVHTLQAASPAIDAGNVDGCRDYDDTLLILDQPGEDRSRGFGCDVGAAESGYFAGRVLVTPVSGSETTEAGGSARLSFKLNGTPSSSLTVSVSSSNPAEGSLKVDSVVFPSGINQEQIVWVYGVDDDVIDGDVAYQVITGSVKSHDVRFSGFDPDDVSVTNLDDDAVVIDELIFLDGFE